MIDSGFLRTAYREALGLKLDDTTGKAAEFVRGQYPFFFLQTGGVMVSVTFGARRYGHSSYREAFPHHHILTLRKAFGFFAHRRLARHAGWIGACLVRELHPSGKDPYLHVIRTLSPFAMLGAAIAIVAPRTGKASIFTDMHQEAFRRRDVSRICSDLVLRKLSFL